MWVGGWVDTSCALGLLRFDFLEGRRERGLWMISSAKQTDRSWLKYKRQAILVLAPGRRGGGGGFGRRNFTGGA